MKFQSAITAAVCVSGAMALAKDQVVMSVEQHMGQEPTPVPMFTDKTMPAVSTTLMCIINLSTQYFIIYTALAVVRTLNQLYGGYQGAASMLVAASSTVVYAPVLSVLFLGCRMRAIQLTGGETEKYFLPQPWVQEAMQVSSWSVLAQVCLVLVMPIFTGKMEVQTDADGNVDLDAAKGVSKTTVNILNVLKYLTMVSLYGGALTVIYGIFTMVAPKEVFADGTPPVSPAVSATVNLSSQFLVIYAAAAITRTALLYTTSADMKKTYNKLIGALTLAQFTVNFAPMLCVLFIGARMRALQMDPKNGAPQAWAQNCFYLCAYSIMFQCVMVISMPFLYPSVTCKKGDFEGDVVFEGLTGLGGKILTALRWIAVLSTYGGFTAVMYSVFVITAPGDAPTPPLSPAMMCVMNLTAQYFTIYLVLFLAQTAKQFLGTGGKVAEIMEQARGTVMYAPMLSIMFIGCRMRALQLTKAQSGEIPMGAGPQSWAQDCMFLATWAVLIQVCLVIVLSLLYPIQMDEDGNVLPPKNASPWVGYTLNFLRYFCMISMYGGASVIVYAIAVMTPETLPPYAKKTPLVEGMPEVPVPPNPPTAKFFF